MKQIELKGRTIDVLDNIKEVKNTSNGRLFSRFYNRKQLFKFMKENDCGNSSDEGFNGKTYLVVGCNERTTEDWFIEITEASKIDDAEFNSIFDDYFYEVTASFFVEDNDGNVWFVKTDID